MWSVWLGETVVSAGAAIVSGIFPDDSSALLEEELQQVDTERLLCNLDDACELRDAVDLLSRASQRKPLALLPQLESLWYRVLLASVRSPDPRTHRQGAKALSVMTEPLSGLQKRVHSHIVSGLTDWLGALVALAENPDSATQEAASEMLRRCGCCSHETLEQLVQDQGLQVLRCLAVSNHSFIQRPAASALASLLTRRQARSGDDSDSNHVHILVQEIGLAALVSLASSSDECTRKTTASAIDHLLADSSKQLEDSKVVDEVNDSTLELVVKLLQGEALEESLRIFCVRILAHVAAREDLRQRSVAAGAAPALIGVCQQIISLPSTPGPLGQSAVCAHQPVTDIKDTAAVKTTVASQSLADPYSTVQLCIYALADLTTTPQFAQLLLARDEDLGMNALMSLLSNVVQVEMASRSPDETNQSAVLLHASRAIRNLVISDSAGCLAELVGGAVFETGLFLSIILNLVPAYCDNSSTDDPLVLRHIACVLAELAKVYSPISLDNWSADENDAPAGCGSAVVARFSRHSGVSNSSWSNLSGILLGSNDMDSSSVAAVGSMDQLTPRECGHHLSSVCGSKPEAMLPRIVRECDRLDAGISWLYRIAATGDTHVCRSAAALYAAIAMTAHSWLVCQAGNAVDDLADSIMALAIVDDAQTRQSAKLAIAALVKHHDMFKAAVVELPSKLKPLLQILCKLTVGNAKALLQEKQSVSFILRCLTSSSGCRHQLLTGPLADVISDVLRIYEDDTKNKVGSEFVGAILHLMEDENNQTTQQNAVQAVTNLCSVPSLQRLLTEMGVLPLLTGLLTSQSDITRSNACAALQQLSEDGFLIPTNSRAIAASGKAGNPASLDLDGGITQVDESQLEFLGRLGSGAYGEVFHGRWRHSDVAIKCVFTERNFHKDEKELQLSQFRNEVDIMMRLRHPNIVLLMGVLVRPPRLCIISELCHRGSLYQILHRPSTRLRSRDGDGLRPLPAWPRRLQMMLDAARGCQFLHSHDPCIGHLDLKSPNFLVDKNCAEIRLALHNGQLQKCSKEVRLHAVIAMTAHSDLACLSEPFNEMADLYSYGVVLWELCTRKKPFAGMIPHQVMAAVGFNGLQLPRPTAGDIPPGLVDIMYRCMAREFRDRPRFDEVLGNLEIVYRSLQKQAASSQN